MVRVTANTELCEGYANCVEAAPDIYDIDEDGVVVLLRKEISGDERTRAEEATRSCPVRALALED